MSTTTRWALEGEISRDLLTWNGRVLVHGNRAELEFLIAGARTVPCPRSVPPEDTLEIRFHPQFSTHQFPLRRGDFR